MHIQGTYNNFSQSEFIYPNYNAISSVTLSNGLISKATMADGTSTQAELDMNYRKTKVTNDSYNLAGTWHVSDRFTLSGNGGWSKATGGTNPEYLMSLYSNGGYTFDYTGSSTTVNYNTAPTDTEPVGPLLHLDPDAARWQHDHRLPDRRHRHLAPEGRGILWPARRQVGRGRCVLQGRAHGHQGLHA
jgi:hypothetical protein